MACRVWRLACQGGDHECKAWAGVTEQVLHFYWLWYRAMASWQRRSELEFYAKPNMQAATMGRTDPFKPAGRRGRRTPLLVTC